MPTEPAIIDTSIISVKSSTKDNYNNLIVTPESGEPIKISEKRRGLFDIFQEGASIKLFWAEYMHKKYVARAELVSGDESLVNKEATTTVSQAQKPEVRETDLRQASIEAQNSNTAIGNWICKSMEFPNSPMALKPSDPFVQAFKAYNASKLSNWYSQGEIEETHEPQKIIESDGKIPEFKTAVELVEFAKSHGWNGEDIRIALKANKPSDIKDLKKAAQILFPDKEVPF